MLTIAWDIDDVLNDLMRCWFEGAWKRDHPDCSVLYEGLVENPPHRVLGISKECYLRSLDDFRANFYCSETRPLLPVKKWFDAHGHEFRHIALTAVPLPFADISARWVLANFGRWIRTYHFVPSYRPDDEAAAYDRTKKDFLKRVQNVDFLIDDNEASIEDARSVGVRGVIFPRPWNVKRRVSIETALQSISGKGSL